MIIDIASPAERVELRRGPGRKRLEVTNARVRSVSEGEPVTTGYATLLNEAAFPLTIVAFESPAFDRVELREPVARNGAVSSRPIDSLEIEPGECVELAPGGRYLALSGPRQLPEEGQLVGITVTFSCGQRRVIPFRLMGDAARRDARAPGETTPRVPRETNSWASLGSGGRRAPAGRSWSAWWASASRVSGTGRVPIRRASIPRGAAWSGRWTGREHTSWWAWSGLLRAGESRAPGRA